MMSARFATLLGLIFVFLFGVIFLGYTGRDDSHITYFVSDMVAEGRGVVNYNGETIDQTSTLLHTYVLAAVTFATGLLGAQTGPYLSVLYLLLTLPVALMLARAIGGNAVAVLALVSMPSLYWSLSGMEQSLYVLLLFGLTLVVHQLFARPELGLERKARELVLIALFSGCLTLTRPEFPMVIALTALLFILLSGPPRLLSVAGAASLGVGALLGLGFRLAIGLRVFPNTVYAKQGDASLTAEIMAGMRYLYRTFLNVPLSSVVAFTSFVVVIVLLFRTPKAERSKATIFALCLVVAVSAFAVSVGGDWMENGRFLVAPMTLAIFLGLSQVPQRVTAYVAAGFSIGLALSAVNVARMPYGGVPLFASYSVETTQFAPSRLEYLNAIHARDVSFIEKSLQEFRSEENAGEPLTVASIQAGMVPYYLMHAEPETLYFVDLVGLSTDHVHNCRQGEGWSFNPYDNLVFLQDCGGVTFDYVYDLDGVDWPRLSALQELGCREVFREDFDVGPFFPLDAPLGVRQFLADCRPAFR